MDEPKKRMVSQTIAYSDGTETVINYNVDEEALQAVEAAVAENTDKAPEYSEEPTPVVEDESPEEEEVAEVK